MNKEYLDIPEHLKSHEVLLGWHVVDMIGSGGAGRVYRIENENKEAAALKWIHYEKHGNILDEKLLAAQSQMINEILTQVKLADIEQVVRIRSYAVVNSNDGRCIDALIRMDLMSSFTDWMRNNRRTVQNVTEKLGDICTAVDACHKKGIVHRDIKPGNILVAADGFKLSDFGVAGLLDAQEGQMNYTKAFAPPEYKSGEAQNEAGDIYSLGLTAYTIFNNDCLPYQEGTSREARNKAWAARSEAIAEGHSLYPAPAYAANEEIAKIICKACAIDPAARYKSAGEFYNELRQAVNKAGNYRNMVLPFGEMDVQPLTDTTTNGDTGRTTGRVTQSVFEGSKNVFPQSQQEDERKETSSRGAVLDFNAEGIKKNDDSKEELVKESDEDKKKHSKLGIICAAVLVVAALLYGGYTYFNGKKPVAHQATYTVQALTTYAHIVAEEGYGTTTYTWYPKNCIGAARSQTSTDGNCELKNLLPDTVYVLSDDKNPSCTFHTGFDTLQSEAELILYRCSAQFMKNLNNIAKLGSSYYPETSVMELKYRPAASQPNCYFVRCRVDWNNVPGTEEMMILLRMDSGEIYTGVASLEGTLGSMGCFELSGVIDEMYKAGSKMSSGDGTIELYAGACRLGIRSIKITGEE